MAWLGVALVICAPDGDFEATMRIRKLSPRISCVPIIGLSAHHHDEVRVPRLSSSMNEFLSKSVNAVSLLAKVQYEKTAQFIGLPTASPRSHRYDGDKAGLALTFKPDHSMGHRPETVKKRCKIYQAASSKNPLTLLYTSMSRVIYLNRFFV